MNFEIGDWVSGNSNQGEFVHGYIESLDSLHGMVGIRVIASDNEPAVGKVSIVRQHGVKKLAESVIDTEDGIRSLIDLALMTRDEMWFKALSGQLLMLQAADGQRDEISDALDMSPSLRNRLRFYMTK